MSKPRIIPDTTPRPGAPGCPVPKENTMTTNTPDPEKLRLARAFAGAVNAAPKAYDVQVRAAADLILSLPEPPAPTMAELPWDDEKYFLAEAETGRDGNIVMLYPDEERIICYFPNKTVGGVHVDGQFRSKLTPTGRKFRLLYEEYAAMLDPVLEEPVSVSSEGITESSDVSSEPLDPTDAQDLADLPVEDAQPRTVQDLVHHFEGRAESELGAGDAHVADVWQQAADTLWTTLGKEPAPLPAPEDCKPGEAWLVEHGRDRWVGAREAVHVGLPPWALANMNGETYCAAEDRNIRILARLTPDREVEQ